MKTNDFTELRKKSVVELSKLVEERRRKLVLAKTEMKAGKEKNLKKVKQIKGEVAKILTLIREMEILGKGKDGSKEK